MPAINMGGDPTAENPSTGRAVMMSPFSGPKGSMLDNDQPGNHSTGALNTGIGFGPNLIINAPATPNVRDAGFNVPYTPGVSKPNNTDAADATLVAIGGGRSKATENGESDTVPLINADNYGAPLFAFGNGAQRDGANAGQGRYTQLRTVAATVANGSNIANGLTNRSGKTLTSGQSALGIRSNASNGMAAGGILTITALNVDNTAKTVDPAGTVVMFADGAELTITVTQDTTSVTGDGTVSGNSFDTDSPISLATFVAGNITVEVSGVDEFGFTVTVSQTAAYAPV